MPVRIGRYEVEGEVGSGTAVKVFHATDRDTGRPVTLKVVTAAEDPRLVELFRRKVAIAAQLRHENFTPIYELGEHNGLPFAAMQRAGPDDLRQAIRSRVPLTLLRKLTILCQIAEGLQAAHDGGLGSAVIRPSGIVLGEDGAAVIHDFSIVRRIGDSEDEEASYASPEELSAGLTPDALCDVFAFGMICREFLAGDDPLAEPLAALVDRATETNRERRYQSINELLEDAEPILCELKRARAAALLAEARRLNSGGDLEAAQAALRELLELDPANRQALRMQAAIRVELQRRHLQSRVKELIREAEQEAATRRFARAVEILDSAHQLDSTNLEVTSRLEKMCERLERSQNASQLVADARQLLVEQKLAEAEAKAAQAREQDRELAEIDDVLQAIAEAKSLAHANTLLAQQSFDAAIAIVQGLRAQYRESTLLDLWLERAHGQKAEAERQQRLQAELAAVRTLLAQEQLHAALIQVAMLGDEFPGNGTVADLHRQATEAIARADLVRQVLGEAQFLLDQDRPHLAAQFLCDKCREMPDEPQLAARLTAVEAMLADWERRRLVQDSLERAAALEQQEQWAVALALVEQALEACPDAEELLQTSARLREKQREADHRKKLRRRLEAIGVKMAADAWPQAMRLIEAAQNEFPGEPVLAQLLEEARAGLRRSECETVVLAVRQCLADGDTARAEMLLGNGVASLGAEPALENLRQELEAARQQQDAWYTAQALFGRRRYREAEEILAALAAEDRADAKALLETVRSARAASEEDDFYKRGREQALKLIEQRQFQPAADLLDNLLKLFPGDPILERDLELVQASLPPPPPVPEEPDPVPAAPRLEVSVGSAVSARVLWAAMAGLLLLVSASAGVWKLSQNGPPPPPAMQLPKALHAPAPATPAAALRRNIHGIVKLEATIGADGAVTDVRALSGDPILIAAARDAVRTWHYQPGARNGRPAEMKVEVQVQFGSRK